MKTTENNKLIAEFMGYKFKPNNTIQTDIGTICADDIKFHSDWNWLMEVVVKCFEKYSELDNQQSVFNADNQQFKLNDALLLTDIKELYKAVVDFIKWYNQQKK